MECTENKLDKINCNLLDFIKRSEHQLINNRMKTESAEKNLEIEKINMTQNISKLRTVYDLLKTTSHSSTSRTKLSL